ncbi:MAG: hypothetical protein E7624_01260 [Ruminococcaceae bacterium]|nr:hypothetical protein [Oscillospiraceae bacterium]
MKKTRVLALFLFFLMLLGTAALFSSCGGTEDGVVTLEGDLQSIDIKNYAVVYAKSFYNTGTMVDHANSFADRVHAATGAALPCVGENKTTTTASDPEILIGLTGRAESTAVLSEIKGDGFAIKPVGNKIVIAGTSYMHVLMGMEYFCEKYLPDASGTSVPVYERAVAEELESVVLDATSAKGVSMIHEAGLAADRIAGNTTNSGGRDLPCKLIDDLSEDLCSRLSINSKKDKNASFVKKDDTVTRAGTEFLVGRVNRDFAKECLQKLSGTEYGFFVGEDIVLTSYNDDALEKGGEALSKLLADAVTEENGQKKICLPKGFSLKRSVNPEWITDFTRPSGEGIVLTNTQDCANNSVQYYYTGDGIGAESYRAYCDVLKGEGYTVVTQSEAEQSLYTTFVDPTNTFTLYVAYNAYAHKDQYNYPSKNGERYDKCFRVISAPLSSVNLPDAGLLTQNPAYVRKTASAITAMEIKGEAVGMGYILTLEDGRFIVFDGGGVNSTAPNEFTDLWNLLCAANERITGKETSAANPVHLAAWVNTHSHGDHYYAFLKMIQKYGPTGALKMDYLLGNFPSETAIYRQANSDILTMGNEKTMSTYQKHLPDGFKFVKVHAGQHFYLANVELEVITTYEDLNPARITTQNDTNTVMRITVHTTNEAGQRVGEGVKTMWLGDANALQSRYMCTMFGDYLKSDTVQLAHHGNVGCEKDLYSCVSAKVLWFPMDYWRFELFTFTGKHPTIQAVNRHALSLPSMQYVYVSANNDEFSNNYNICLPFDAETGEPDYDGIYEGLTGEPLSYDGKSAFNNTDPFK